MRRVGSGVAVVAATVLLGGCDAMQELPGAVPTATPDASFEAGGVHLMPMYGEATDDQAALEANASASGTKLNYYGGHVLSNAKVVVVYWGGNVSSTTQTKIGGFYQAVLDSPYMDWLSEYDTNASGGTNQHIGRGSYAGAVTITPSHSGSTIDDSEIQSEINSQISAGKLPAPDANTIYMTYFPKGTTITQGGSQSCAQFCAYHGTFKRGGKSTFYGVMPDMSSGSGCDTGCGSASSMFDNLTSASSHELIEAVTDAEIGLATSVGKPMAWYDPNNGEIGDICNGSDASVAGYNVQKEWSNSSHGCIATKSGTGASDFSVTLSPASTSVAPGVSATVTVKTMVTSGAAQSITLSASGLPTGVTASFSPATITAGSTSTLTLTASSSAPATTKSVSVKAAGSATTHTSTETLTVGTGTPPPSTNIANGGFEGSLTGWTLGGAKKPIDSSAQAHGGSRSLRAGSTSTTEPNGDSWAYQSVAIPASATSAQLSFWYYAWTTDTISHDWQEMQIRDASGTTTLKSVFKIASNDRVWTEKTVDLSAYAGKTVQVWFNVHSDGGSTPTSMWVDDVSLVVQ